MTEDLNTAVFTVKDVVMNNAPILHVVHDHDGDWQFLTGYDVSIEDAMIIALGEAFEMDKSLVKIANMKEGFEAYRERPTSEWKISPLPPL